MLHEQTIEKLYALRLHAMAHTLEEQIKQPDMAGLAFEERLAMLVDAQWLWKENRALSLRLKNACMKHRASMENINYRHVRQLDRSQMRSLASCGWGQTTPECSYHRTDWDREEWKSVKRIC
jgi:hypothetical protein